MKLFLYALGAVVSIGSLALTIHSALTLARAMIRLDAIEKTLREGIPAPVPKSLAPDKRIVDPDAAGALVEYHSAHGRIIRFCPVCEEPPANKRGNFYAEVVHPGACMSEWRARGKEPQNVSVSDEKGQVGVVRSPLDAP